jgi:hypothetical protein
VLLGERHHDDLAGAQLEPLAAGDLDPAAALGDQVEEDQAAGLRAGDGRVGRAQRSGRSGEAS